MYNSLAIISIITLVFFAAYLAYKHVRMIHILAVLMVLGLISVSIVSFAEPPTDLKIEVITVKETINIFVESEEASNLFVRLQKPNGEYLEDFRVNFQKVGERSHAAFETYLSNEDCVAVVFFGNKAVKRIKLK